MALGDLSDLLGGNDGNDLFDALDIPLPINQQNENENENENEKKDQIEIVNEEEDIEIDNNDNDNDNDNDDIINFPKSFLINDMSMDWKMLEFLCNNNKTNELMNILSRFKLDINIFENKLDIVNYNKYIPNTLELYSDLESEITSTQLSYNLMRLLSIDNDNNEVVSSYLLRKCREITLHALAVYNRNISLGNVYHGRVLLEILLNTWPKSLMNILTETDEIKLKQDIILYNIQILFKNALFRNLHQGNLNSFFLDLICYKPDNEDKYKQILPYKIKIINLFKKWKFMEYLLSTSSSFDNEKFGIGNDDVQTKYATFFIDLIARSAAINEVSPLFEQCEHLIIDSFINGLLDIENKRTTWHRMFCGQILIQFMDICSRPTIMDPTQLLAAESGLIEPEPSPNILYPLFDKCLKRLHEYIPKLTKLLINYKSDYKIIKLNYTTITKPFGQIRLHCLELLTISADFAQFECGNVLGKIPINFWEYLIDMAFIHKNNNIFLCHFRRLIHLTMIFRRRILKHLFIEKNLLDKFITFYANKNNNKTALHGYILQMIYDIWQHDQDIDDEDNQQENNDTDQDDDDDDDDNDSVKNIVSQYL